MFRAFHARLYTPGNATADRRRRRPRRTSQCRMVLTGISGGLPGGRPDMPEVAAAPQVSSRERSVLVDKPGAAQSEIRIGRIGTDRLTPDYYPAAGDEHDPRGFVHLPPQPQPPREARLQLRRRLGLRPFRLSAGPLRRGAEVQTDR